MEQWMFNIFSGGGVLIIGFLAWIVRSMIKNTEGLTHLREDMKEFKTEIKEDMRDFKAEIKEDMREFKEEIRGDMKHLENQVNRIDARLDYLLIFNRRPMDESSRHDNP